MIATLALILSVAPQEPTPAELLRQFHRDVIAEEHVAAVAQALVATPDGRMRGVETPAFVVAMRKAGVDALDVAGTVLALTAPTEAVDRSFAWVRDSAGLPATDVDAPEAPDLREFERICSHAHRDLVQALGSGRELDIVAPELHAAVDQIRKSIENLDELTGDKQTLLQERLARLTRVDRAEVQRLAERIARAALALDRPELKEAMRRQATKSARSDGAVVGDVLLDRDTTFGRLVVGGFERNVYDCSQIDVLVDLGGDDEYRGEVAGAGERRRLAVVVDLDGNDSYAAGNDGLGSGTFGIGVLVDTAGNDAYHGLSRSAGFGLAGAGILIDVAGDDRFDLGDQSGGVGLAGIGMFVDLAGADQLTAGVQSLGCGLPGGVGLALDVAGNDVRKLGVEDKRVAIVRDAALQTTDHDTPRLQPVSVGFGAGVGALPFLSGGAGAFVDLDGDDTYEAGGLAFGVGVRGGVGVFRDAAGDDSYRAGDVALGAAYAHGLGVMRDEGGNDRYEADHLALGAASGHGIALFLDSAGDDRYSAIAPALGAATRFAVGALLDLGGNDEYVLRRGPAAWQVVAEEADEGVSIGVLLHLGGGNDHYVFDRLQEPQNDRTRTIEGGDARNPERHVFVDR